MTSLRGNSASRYCHTADESSRCETAIIDKLTPMVGAEIGGVDLSAPLPAEEIKAIRHALGENSVIALQTLSREQHLSFGRNFGNLRIHLDAPHIRSGFRVTVVGDEPM
jgi:taurine dioxygenase